MSVTRSVVTVDFGRGSVSLSLRQRFEVLTAQLDLMNKLGGDLRSLPEWTDSMEAEWEERAGLIIDDLAEVAWAAEAVRARGHDDLVIKAHILLHWCEDRKGDIVHSLAASLCQDLIGEVGAMQTSNAGGAADVAGNASA